LKEDVHLLLFVNKKDIDVHNAKKYLNPKLKKLHTKAKTVSNVQKLKNTINLQNHT